MGKRIVITGAAGFVGGNIIRQANEMDNYTFFGIDIYDMSFSQNNLYSQAFDLLNREELYEFLEKIKPDVIVHLAALSNIDYCETNKEQAEKINVDITRNIVEFCQNYSSRLIYFSSDSIFDGKRGLYREEDIPRPLHYYGQTKVKSEGIVKDAIDNFVIIRPSLIMGLPVGENGNSFLWRMIKSMKKGNAVAFPKSEIRSPVDVITLSRAILELANHDYTGILHISGNDVINRYDMAKRIADNLGYPTELVIDRKPEISSGRAPRPKDVSLDNSRAKKILKTRMVGLDRGIQLVIENAEDKDI